MTEIFQLTAVSQNDRGCSYGNDYTGTLTENKGGVLRSDSASVNKPVHLPTPQEAPAPTKSNWFLELDGEIEDAFFTIVIDGPDGNFPIPPINGKDVKKWKAINEKDPTNQIYRKGNCGIFGYATPYAPDGWIYTITVAVTDPKIHPPGT